MYTRSRLSVRKASYELGKQQPLFTKPPPPLVATTRTRGVRVVSTGATGLASRRTPASVSNHHVAPPFPQGARRCSASAPLGVGSRRAAAIPGGECTHPQFVRWPKPHTRLWTVRSCFSSPLEVDDPDNTLHNQSPPESAKPQLLRGRCLPSCPRT